MFINVVVFVCFVFCMLCKLTLCINQLTYQCPCKVQPSMVIVEVFLGSMVSIVSKLIHLEQEGQVSQTT